MSDYKVVNENDYPVRDFGNDSMSRYERFWNRNDDDDSNQNSMVPLAPLDPKTGWFRKYWRPAIAWQYLVVCLFDFLIAPVMVMMYYYYTGGEYQQWSPLTLVSGGFYHIAMGAVTGITAYGRSLEKKAGVDY